MRPRCSGVSIGNIYKTFQDISRHFKTFLGLKVFQLFVNQFHVPLSNADIPPACQASKGNPIHPPGPSKDMCVPWLASNKFINHKMSEINTDSMNIITSKASTVPAIEHTFEGCQVKQTDARRGSNYVRLQ